MRSSGKRARPAVATGRVPSPFDTTNHKTERSGVAVLMSWMRDIIEARGLGLGLPDVETSGADRKMPDAVIYESRRSRKVLCVIEAKQPFFDVFGEGLKDDARQKANRRKARYFATTNFKQLLWWKTAQTNDPALPEEEQLADRYELSEIENLSDLDGVRYSRPTRRALERFLVALEAVHTGRAAEPRLVVDELLVYRLHERVRVLSRLYRGVIEDRCHKDGDFARKLIAWFGEQRWAFAWQPADFEKAALQTAYLLVNKLLFYNLLQAKRPAELSPLQIPEGLVRGAQLQRILQTYFDEVLKIDYETIYTTDFIDSVAFPDVREIVTELETLVAVLRRHDFSALKYDIIGGIFERLIPEQERHNLGQYFTRSDVVDLILRFCLKHEDDRVLDPACGAGTFLVRAYQHKRVMNQRKSHEDILETLWGNDIAKFPAHLATINLAICDLSVDRNYPNVIKEDFFALPVSSAGFALPPQTRKRRAVTLGVTEREVPYPRWFDAIVGNPPYTRQEEIPSMEVDKAKLVENALKLNDRSIADISRRAGIHAYFFVHGTKFLHEGGRFGFIVSNSWLDVDYGKGLQEFFLSNYRIIAVIESKVERWFEDADVNTCIVILEKCAAKRKRDANLARFVYLKKPLRHFIPPAQDMWEKQVERLRAIDGLLRTVLAHDRLYENEDLRVFPKIQRDLWAEGFDQKQQKYAGAKWGKYLRAPEIFFKVLHKGGTRLTPLRSVASIRAGCYSGINDFFYFSKKPEARATVERRYLVPILRSTRQVVSLGIKTAELDSHVFVCRRSKEELKKLDETRTLRYIQWGERQVTRKRQKVRAGVPWPKVETVKKRKPGWWALSERDVVPSGLFIIYVVNDRFIAPFSDAPIASDRCFHRVLVRRESIRLPLAAFLNSTLTWFSVEVLGRSNLGLGALKFEAMDAAQIVVLDPTGLLKWKAKLTRALRQLARRAAGSVFEELGSAESENVSLDKVKPDRRELDRIVMGEILGLSEEEQLEVYRAVIDLVRSRIERARSVGSNSRTRDGVDLDALSGAISQFYVKDGA